MKKFLLFFITCFLVSILFILNSMNLIPLIWCAIGTIAFILCNMCIGNKLQQHYANLHPIECNVKTHHLDDIKKMATKILFDDKMKNRQLEIFEVLAIASKEFLCSLDPNGGKVERMLSGIVSALNITHGYMFKLNNNTNLFELTYCTPANSERVHITFDKINETDFPETFLALRSNKNIIGFDNFSKLELRLFNSTILKSVIWIPIFVDNRFTGFMGFDSYRDKHWSNVEIEMLGVVSEIFAAWCGRRRAEKFRKK